MRNVSAPDGLQNKGFMYREAWDGLTEAEPVSPEGAEGDRAVALLPRIKSYGLDFSTNRGLEQYVPRAGLN